MRKLMHGQISILKKKKNTKHECQPQVGLAALANILGKTNAL